MDLLKKIKLNNWQKAMGTIIIFPWYLYFAPIIIKFFLSLYTTNINNNFSEENLNAWFNLLIGLSTVILLMAVFKNFIIENWKIFKQDLLENIIWILTIGIGVAYLFSYLGELVVNLLLPFDAQEATNQALVTSLISSNVLIMSFQAVIVAPVVEELLFRGLVFNSIRQKSIVWAHVISAFLFGLLHVYSYILAGDMTEWIKLIPYMAVGLALSFAYEKRQNIIAPIILHGVKNLIAVILIYIVL